MKTFPCPRPPAAHMLTRPRIAVLVESSRGYGRSLLQGIAAYVREHGPWTVDIQERRLYDAAPKWLRRWQGDGIIARIANPRFAREIGRLRLPTVDLVGLHQIEGVPVIITDHEAVVRHAADHLLSLGLSQFAFCGFAGSYYSEKSQPILRGVHGRQGPCRPRLLHPLEAPPLGFLGVGGGESAAGGQHGSVAAVAAEAGRPAGRHR